MRKTKTITCYPNKKGSLMDAVTSADIVSKVIIAVGCVREGTRLSRVQLICIKSSLLRNIRINFMDLIGAIMRLTLISLGGYCDRETTSVMIDCS